MKDSLPRNKRCTQMLKFGVLLMSFCAVNVASAQALDNPSQDSPLARALKDNTEKVTSISGDKNMGHWLTINPVELTDNSGLVYLGGRISKAQVDVYLNLMKAKIGDEFPAYRQNQAARDHHTFHVTLINPYEYQHIDTSKIDKNKGLSIELAGLGSVSNETDTAYYVVVNSSDGQYFRQQFQLNKKDFHVTLGFNKSDVYNRKKDRSTLLID